MLPLFFLGPFAVVPYPDEEIEKELGNLEEHHDGHAEEETERSSQSGEKSVNLEWKRGCELIFCI